jgi:hypothetical protein
MAKKQKDLVQIIRDNPGCVAMVDNDCWRLFKSDPEELEIEDDDEYEKWEEANLLATNDDIKPLGDGGYGSGNCYGGDILQALAIIVGVKISSV